MRGSGTHELKGGPKERGDDRSLPERMDQRPTKCFDQSVHVSACLGFQLAFHFIEQLPDGGEFLGAGLLLGEGLYHQLAR